MIAVIDSAWAWSDELSISLNGKTVYLSTYGERTGLGAQIIYDAEMTEAGKQTYYLKWTAPTGDPTGRVLLYLHTIRTALTGRYGSEETTIQK